MIDLAVMDETTTDLPEWAGAAQRIRGGTVLFAWEKLTTPQGSPGIYVLEAPGPYGPFDGEPILLNDPIKHGGFDPTWFKTPDGQIWVGWSGEQSFWVAQRNAANDYGDPQRLWSGAVDEAMVEPHAFYIDGKAWVTYDVRRDFSAEVYDAKIREIGNDLSLGPERLIAAKALGVGNQGRQIRITLVGNGDGDLIAAWNGIANPAGERSLWVSRSDDGESWSKPVQVATYPGHDLVNPTGVRVSDTDVRLYFAQDKAKYPFGYIKTTDHGATWGSRTDVVDTPPRIGTTHVYVFRSSPDLVAFVHAEKFTKLGTFKLESIG